MSLSRPRFLFTIFLVVQAIVFVIAHAFVVPHAFVLEAAGTSLIAAVPMWFAESMVSQRGSVL